MTEPSYEQLKAESERVCRERDRCRELFDCISAGVFVGSSDWRIAEVNRAGCELLGYTRDELVGRPVSELNVEIEFELFHQLYQKVLEGRPIAGEFRLKRKDGATVLVELRASLASICGEMVFVGLVQDISARKSLERRMVREERLASVGTLAAGIAHQFNNILFRIMGSAEEALEYKPNLEIGEALRTIISSCEEAGAIAERLLSYARRRPPRRQMVNPVNIMEHTLQMLESELTQAGVEVVRDYKPVFDMMLDNVQIGQVFRNLITNARDAMLQGGRLTVACRVEDNRFIAQLTDTGIGMPPELKDTIFQPFVTTKGAFAGSELPGLGLGLSVCEGIVASHGGEIDVQSAVDKGSTFTVRLPVVLAAEEPGAKEPQKP